MAEKKLRLSDFNFTDLHNYPNVGKNRLGEIVEFSYNGNSLLRTTSDRLYRTTETYAEWEKCKNDEHYFIENYIKIQTIDDGVIPFKMRDYQYELSNLINDNKKIIATLPRQGGKTVLNAAKIVYRLVFFAEKNVGLVANINDLRYGIVDLVKKMYELLPPWLQHGVVKWNASGIELSNKAKLMSAIVGPSALRGQTISVLFCDEVAFCDQVKLNGFFDSAFPALASGKDTKIILISTPNGLDKFYEYFEGAKQGTNGFVHFWMDYTRIPGRDEKWKEAEIKSSSPLLFARNHGCMFLGSSPTLLKAECLTDLSLKKRKPLYEHEDISPGLKIYEDPEEDSLYCIGVDSAKASATSGVEDDYIAMQVLKIDVECKKIKQVATLRTKDIHYLEIAEIAYELGMWYNEAMLVVELNEGAGAHAADTLFETYEYENLLCDPNRSDVNGFRTTQKTKSVGLSNLKKLIENEIMEVYDIDTIDEFATFIKSGVSFAAQKGSHDDTVMALCIALYWLLDIDNEFELTLEDFLGDAVIVRDVEKPKTEREDYDSLDFMASSNTYGHYDPY